MIIIVDLLHTILGCELGVAHPPGYPLFTVMVHFLIKLVRYFPHLTPAYFVNLSSAVFTSLAAALIGLSIKLSTKPSVYTNSAIMLSMGMFAFSPLIWQYATTAEVFPMNTFFAALIIYLIILFTTSHNLYIAYFGAFICGLALCNQHTIILYEVPLILWILYLLKHTIYTQPITLLMLSLSFLVGLIPYIYLPLSDLFNPRPGSWGRPSTLQGFIHHILRRDYGTFKLYSGDTSKKTTNEGLYERNIAYFNDLYEYQGLYCVHILVAIAVLFFAYYPTAPASATVTPLTLSVSAPPTASAKGTSADPKFPMALNRNVSVTKRKSANPSSTTTATTTPIPTASPPTPLPPTLSLQRPNSYLTIPAIARYTPTVLILTQAFYLTVFHGLSNLPLSDPLLYGVHKRFWMQPAVLTFYWAGIGYLLLAEGVEYMAILLSHAVTTRTAKTKHNNNSNIPYNSDQSIRYITYTISSIYTCIAMFLVYTQYKKWLGVSDQSQANYFARYATAMLTPLPPKALLFVSYDQQWTSIR